MLIFILASAALLKNLNVPLGAQTLGTPALGSYVLNSEELEWLVF